MYVSPVRTSVGALGGLALGVEGARSFGGDVLPATGVSIVPLVILGLVLLVFGLALLRMAAVKVANRSEAA